MDHLPLELEHIILDYEYQLEHVNKFKNVVDAIKDLRCIYERSCAEYVKECGEYPEPFGTCMLICVSSPHFI